MRIIALYQDCITRTESKAGSKGMAYNVIDSVAQEWGRTRVLPEHHSANLPIAIYTDYAGKSHYGWNILTGYTR